MRSHRMPSRSLIALVTVMLLVGQTSVVAPSTAANPQPAPPNDEKRAPLSGVVEFRDMNLGTGLTECPQAGMNPDPALDRRTKDRVEQLSQGGDDVRVNPEYSCFPQNETSIAVNPTNARNIVAGANDYRLGWGTSGFYASTNSGQSWYTGLIPFPSLPSGDNLDGGGDPALVFDRSGVVYYADINFNRTDDTNGVFVSRSTNGGYTWSRPCVPINVGTATDDQARCGGAGDPRQPGDGVVVFQTDNNGSADFSVTFHDKEYIGAGPRPAGVTPVCFAPETKTPIPAGAPGCPQSTIGVDRLYVTWTAFNNPVGTPGFITSSTIEMSFSDDMGRSWSARRTVNGSALFCDFAFAGATHCDDNQFSVPTVSRHTGHLYIAFENFDTPDENQWLLVRSRDGGATFEGPFFVTPVFDLNLRLRADCIARGAGRVHLTNSCFRVPQTGAVVVDKRDGLFADDLYLVMSDNRNGTRDSTNTDVFLFKSVDGGSNWVGPTRVNDDPSQQPVNRNCGRSGQLACPQAVHTGNDQWWPWVDIGERGDLNVVFHDRRLDTDSVASEWPTSRTRPGNYLVWFWGGQCRVTTADSRECVAPTAALISQPTAPINPGNEAFSAQTEFPLRNFTISDTPSNFDYTFRAGIFAGDYSGMAIGPDNQAWAAFTDARNGRSSREQSGRNPACEQSDIFVDGYSAVSGGTAKTAQASDGLFLVVPCPEDAADPGNRP